MAKKIGDPNINLQVMLKAITLDEQRQRITYTRHFGTYIGRLRPMAHGISGSVRTNQL